MPNTQPSTVQHLHSDTLSYIITAMLRASVPITITNQTIQLKKSILSYGAQSIFNTKFRDHGIHCLGTTVFRLSRQYNTTDFQLHQRQPSIAHEYNNTNKLVNYSDSKASYKHTVALSNIHTKLVNYSYSVMQKD